MFDKIVNEIKKRGHKLTPQRLEIIRLLIKKGEYHPSLNEVYEEVKEKLFTVSFSTLYNTIKILEELGVIKLFNLGLNFVPTSFIVPVPLFTVAHPVITVLSDAASSISIP